MARKVVKLLRKSGMYAEGEVAGFPENIANQMIQRGIAQAYEPEPQTQKSNKRRPRPAPSDDETEDKQMRSRGGTANYETK